MVAVAREALRPRMVDMSVNFILNMYGEMMKFAREAEFVLIKVLV